MYQGQRRWLRMYVTTAGLHGRGGVRRGGLGL